MFFRWINWRSLMAKMSARRRVFGLYGPRDTPDETNARRHETWLIQMSSAEKHFQNFLQKRFKKAKKRFKTLVRRLIIRLEDGCGVGGEADNYDSMLSSLVEALPVEVRPMPIQQQNNRFFLLSYHLLLPQHKQIQPSFKCHVILVCRSITREGYILF